MRDKTEGNWIMGRMVRGSSPLTLQNSHRVYTDYTIVYHLYFDKLSLITFKICVTLLLQRTPQDTCPENFELSTLNV